MASKLLTWEIVTPAAGECFTTEQVKNYLKIPSTVTADDDLIDESVISARQLVERRTSNIMISTALAEYQDAFPVNNTTIELGLAPISIFGKVEYLNKSGVLTEFASDDYTTDLLSRPGRIMLKSGKSWPSDVGQFPNAVKLTYSAGSANAASIPGPLRTAMLIMIGAFYYKSTESNAIADAFDFTDRLMAPYIWKK